MVCDYKLLGIMSLVATVMDTVWAMDLEELESMPMYQANKPQRRLRLGVVLRIEAEIGAAEVC